MNSFIYITFASRIMNCTTTISVSELIGKMVHTRESSAILMQLIEKKFCDCVELDFTNVEYISRSFADQFYYDKLNCAVELKKNIIVSNANEAVMQMLNAVAKTQHKKMSTFFNIPIYKYSSQSQLDNFLLSI
ncbi:MAG TPA: hypothetical protein VN726_20585 [Hanamia sp.]|nr:hypothetical protein [Hanamia sp.]